MTQSSEESPLPSTESVRYPVVHCSIAQHSAGMSATKTSVVCLIFGSVWKFLFSANYPGPCIKAAFLSSPSQVLEMVLRKHHPQPVHIKQIIEEMNNMQSLCPSDDRQRYNTVYGKLSKIGKRHGTGYWSLKEVQAATGSIMSTNRSLQRTGMSWSSKWEEPQVHDMSVQGNGISGSKGCLHHGFPSGNTAQHSTARRGTAERCTVHCEITQNAI